MGIPIRIRGPDGQARLEVADNATLGGLLALIRERTGLDRFSLKYGFPPRSLDIDADARGTPVAELPLRGETLIVAPSESSSLPSAGTLKEPSSRQSGAAKGSEEPPTAGKPVDPDETVLEWPEREGWMILRVMPDDNSCLFTALGGALHIDNASAVLRKQVAEYILSHQDQYDKVVLGEDPARYASKIQKLDVWGGAIELGILSDIHNIEISSIDVKTNRVDRFGEEKALRCIILYSGIHYDRIAFAYGLGTPPETDETKWPAADADVLARARALAAKLQRLHYYTDTADFVLRCEQCNWIGQGAADAQKHIAATGHGQFGEMQLD